MLISRRQRRRRPIAKSQEEEEQNIGIGDEIFMMASPGLKIPPLPSYNVKCAKVGRVSERAFKFVRLCCWAIQFGLNFCSV